MWYQGWFIVDLVGSIPFELFTGQSSGYERKAIKASVKYLKLPVRKLRVIAPLCLYFRAHFD